VSSCRFAGPPTWRCGLWSSRRHKTSNPHRSSSHERRGFDWRPSNRNRSGEVRAGEVLEATLARIEVVNPSLNAFTSLTVNRARAEAARADSQVADGKDPGILAGVPYGVKNLYDAEGEVTLAGSIINRDNSPANRDATVVGRLSDAGGVLVGLLNMDEYAYGFTTENSHYGAVRNPHDLERSAGGSSGGSAAAVTAGLVPLALGTDTNGSISGYQRRSAVFTV
jgi:Asp-tRNA(Asn)/Glu-tRNA(Gln) amidotransferase A subunit family amidase